MCHPNKKSRYLRSQKNTIQASEEKNPLLIGGFELRYLTRKRSDTRADCRVPTQTQTTDIESWCLVYGTTPMNQNRQSADARKYRKEKKNINSV